MHVLLAYDSRHGATAEIARVIAEELKRSGREVTVLRVGQVRDVRPFDAVVLGSAVYYGRWLGGARRFLKRFETALRARPLWVFESGPLDVSADDGRAKLARGSSEQAARLGARDHVVFGGRFTREDAGPMMRRAMASGKAGEYGDHRNFERVRTWARSIDRGLGAPAHETSVPSPSTTQTASRSRAETSVPLSSKLQRTLQRFRRA